MLPGATSVSRLGRPEKRIPAALILVVGNPMIPAFFYPGRIGFLADNVKSLDILDVGVEIFVFR